MTEAIDSIDSVLTGAVERRDVPGVVAIAVNGDGAVYRGAAGKARVAGDTEMRLDSIFRIASMTKALTSVAAMQLVERGELSLDEPAESVLPELADLTVLTDEGDLRPPSRPVTLQDLLTHTSGLAYPFSSTKLARHADKIGASGAAAGGSGFDRLLVSDPGERWQYGFSTDWAGRLVEAASGLTLDEYMRRHVFGPLAMPDTSFRGYGPEEPRLTSVHSRSEDGALTEQPVVQPPPPATFSGGAGLSSTAPNYAQFLRLMLGDGALDGARLLGPESMEALCTNQIGNLVAGRWLTGAPDLANDVDFSEGGTTGHSLGFLVSSEPSPTGRSAGCLSWAGILNTYYWVDRARGIAGATFVQVRPFFDAVSLRLRDDFATAVYQSFG
jgi:CubicO group peptidase (beta-lactamase class C family)